MRDLHDGFTDWIAGGGRDELQRDVALHASGCEDCLRLAAALDALLAIDPGAAPIPPARAAPIALTATGPMRIARAAAGTVAIVIVLGAGAIAGSSVFGPRATEPPVAAAEATPAEGILGGAPASMPSPTSVPSESASTDPSPSASPTPDPTIVVAAATPRPTMGGGPPPISTAPPAPPTPVPATPPPTATPTAATPGPTVAPTTAPTAGATPSTTAQPTPSSNPQPTPSNTAPVANDDAYAAIAGVLLSAPAPGVLANDSDADGDSLTAALVENVTSGTLLLSSNGSFTFIAEVGSPGQVSFTYRAFDGTAHSSVTSVMITVSAP